MKRIRSKQYSGSDRIKFVVRIGELLLLESERHSCSDRRATYFQLDWKATCYEDRSKRSERERRLSLGTKPDRIGYPDLNPSCTLFRSEPIFHVILLHDRLVIRSGYDQFLPTTSTALMRCQHRNPSKPEANGMDDTWLRSGSGSERIFTYKYLVWRQRKGSFWHCESSAPFITRNPALPDNPNHLSTFCF